MENIAPPPSGFDPGVVQAVAGRYTDLPINFKLGRPAMSGVSTRKCSGYSMAICNYDTPTSEFVARTKGSQLRYTHH